MEHRGSPSLSKSFPWTGSAQGTLNQWGDISSVEASSQATPLEPSTWAILKLETAVQAAVRDLSGATSVSSFSDLDLSVFHGANF